MPIGSLESPENRGGFMARHTHVTHTHTHAWRAHMQIRMYIHTAKGKAGKGSRIGQGTRAAGISLEKDGNLIGSQGQLAKGKG